MEKMITDLRSDTVTRPTAAMREAMLGAKVGDDVFGEDPTVRELEEKLAAMFGKESAVYCPSGTMCNQIAIKCHTQPMDEMICERLSHVYQYENGGFALHSGISVRLINGVNGMLTPGEIADSLLPRQDWLPRSRLVVIENTANKGGGSYYTEPEMQAIQAFCAANGLRLHLDGARIFNALAENGGSTAATGAMVDSLSICLSKGLGAPVGSVLAGSGDFIAEARRWRKAFGGGMRQAGMLAAAGIYALDHHRSRLALDHTHARILAQALAEKPWVEEILPVKTNIVIFKVKEPLLAIDVTERLKDKKILAIPFSQQQVRFVTHLDIREEMVDNAVKAINSLHFS